MITEKERERERVCILHLFQPPILIGRYSYPDLDATECKRCRIAASLEVVGQKYHHDSIQWQREAVFGDSSSVSREQVNAATCASLYALMCTWYCCISALHAKANGLQRSP